MRYIYSLLIFWCMLSLSWASFADEWELSCEYLWKLDQCVVANKNGSALSIKEFVCLESRDTSRILDQIIIDTKFRVIDDEVILFLEDLRNNKERIVSEPNWVINDVTKFLAKEWYYYRQYKWICQSGVLQERLSCSEEIPNVVGAEYLNGGNYDSRSCMTLVETKLDIYNQIAKNILPLSKSTVQNDTKLLFIQEERTRYDVLLDLMRDILWFIERLANGITHYTPNPYQGS